MESEQEFPRPAAADEIGVDAVEVEIEATAAELAALVGRFDLVSLDRLAASLTLKRDDRTGLIGIDGRMSAAGSQRCVVSLEPVAFELDEPVFCRFEDDAAAETEVELDIDAEDPPEAVESNRIDLGELVVQQLAVALDPYPRAAGVEIPADGMSYGQKEGEAAENHPFAALRRLK